MNHNNDPSKSIVGNTCSLGGWAIDTCTECGNVHLAVISDPRTVNPVMVAGVKGAALGVRGELIATPDQMDALAVALIKEGNRLRALARRGSELVGDLVAAAKEGA